MSELQLEEIIQANKKVFLELCSKINRDGIDKLLAWLEKSDFFTCPASTRFHGAYAGGLLEHSLNVYSELCRLSKAYPEFSFSEEIMIIVALFHYMCKVNFYGVEKRNRKNDTTGQWEKHDAYTYDEQFCFGGHGSKSVYLTQYFIKLTPEEAVAINCHMGAYDGNKDVGRAYEHFPLAWMLHVADESAAYIKERGNHG